MYCLFIHVPYDITSLCWVLACVYRKYKIKKKKKAGKL